MGSGQGSDSLQARTWAGSCSEKHSAISQRHLLDTCHRRPWRDLPPEFGPWESVYTRFRAYIREEVFEQIIERLQRDALEKGNMKLQFSCFDGTYIRAHRHAAGARQKKQATRNRPFPGHRHTRTRPAPTSGSTPPMPGPASPVKWWERGRTPAAPR